MMGVVIQHVPPNEKGRDFFVGDLHGCFNELDWAMRQVNFDYAADRIFSVGDLIDRGPDSMACLAMIDEPYFFAVKGNHEEMMIGSHRYLLGQDGYDRVYGMHMANGGRWMTKAFDNEPSRLADYVQKTKKLPDIIVVHGINVIHAELEDWVTDNDLESDYNSQIDEEYVRWARNMMLMPESMSEFSSWREGLSLTVCGHTPRWYIRFRNSHLCIDIGTFKSGRLVFLDREGLNNTVEQHEARKNSMR